MYDAIIQWEKRQHDVEVRKEEIIFNTGVVYGFYTLIDMLVKHDEKVIVQPPVYPPFFNIPKSLQREVVYNPLQHGQGGWHMDLQHFEECLKKMHPFVCLFYATHTIQRGSAIHWKKLTM